MSDDAKKAIVTILSIIITIPALIITIKQFPFMAGAIHDAMPQTSTSDIVKLFQCLITFGIFVGFPFIVVAVPTIIYYAIKGLINIIVGEGE